MFDFGLICIVDNIFNENKSLIVFIVVILEFVLIFLIFVFYCLIMVIFKKYYLNMLNLIIFNIILDERNF